MSALAFACALCAMLAAARGVTARLDRLEALVADGIRKASRDLEGVRPLNAHANMLGQVVEARKYEASDWETYVVCAVSWHGSLCLRRIDAPDRSGFWIHHDRVPERVREVAP